VKAATRALAKAHLAEKTAAGGTAAGETAAGATVKLQAQKQEQIRCEP
jgi:hypothetical protein